MAEQDRRDILAANRRVDALGAAGERCRLPHHEARDIEDVDAEILDDEPIALGEIGLRGIDVEPRRSEEHTSALQSLMRISYAVFCLQNKPSTTHRTPSNRRRCCADTAQQ